MTFRNKVCKIEVLEHISILQEVWHEKEGKKLELIRKNPRASAVMETDVKDISGGDIPCSYGAGFASIMCFGRVDIVEDEEEKIKGLRLLMKHQTGRDFEITKEMAGGVSVIRLAVNELSCKVHP